MAHTSTLTSKNQTTIPKAVVAAMGIKPSAVLCYELVSDGSVRLTAKASTFAGLAGTFPLRKTTRSVTPEDMRAAVRAAAARKFTRATR